MPKGGSKQPRIPGQGSEQAPGKAKESQKPPKSKKRAKRILKKRRRRRRKHRKS